ncbi:hypothetical protein CYMTET_7663 [Cymbomonas tetramitiformis]|uniref:Photosynthesis system II assembly factor Ycf48/Hcf136-like domain-containing protein n=1 Tax=Cymbomonas tetramitiformis TaxID=36881 RepID=A0AAE0LGS9_9CHLO|nr:hypothetical protein CYMTET_7663 [Cymbomonas tetramitiformis]
MKSINTRQQAVGKRVFASVQKSEVSGRCRVMVPCFSRRVVAVAFQWLCLATFSQCSTVRVSQRRNQTTNEVVLGSEHVSNRSSLDRNNYAAKVSTFSRVSQVGWSNRISTTLFGLSLLSRSEGWLVGAADTLVHTADAGSSWEASHSGLPLPCDGCYRYEWRGVSFHDALRGWVVGNYGYIIYTQDGGVSWAAQTSGTLHNLHAVQHCNDMRVLAVGEADTILRTTDGGAHWHGMSTRTSGMNMYAIDMLNCSHGWVVGFQDLGTGEGRLLRTEDGGGSWTYQSYRPAVALYGVHFHTELVGWAVGQGGTILQTLDGGELWEAARGCGTSMDFNSVAVDPVTLFGFVVGEGGQICLSEDGGTSWTLMKNEEGFYNFGSTLGAAATSSAITTAFSCPSAAAASSIAPSTTNSATTNSATIPMWTSKFRFRESAIYLDVYSGDMGVVHS